MIGYENTLGTVEISQEYFANLIGMAALRVLWRCRNDQFHLPGTALRHHQKVMCPIRACV